MKIINVRPNNTNCHLLKTVLAPIRVSVFCVEGLCSQNTNKWEGEPSFPHCKLNAVIQEVRGKVTRSAWYRRGTGIHVKQAMNWELTMCMYDTVFMSDNVKISLYIYLYICMGIVYVCSVRICHTSGPDWCQIASHYWYCGWHVDSRSFNLQSLYVVLIVDAMQNKLVSTKLNYTNHD